MTGGARGVGGPGKKKEEVAKKDEPVGRWVFLCSWSGGDGHCPPPSDAEPTFSALGLLCIFGSRSALANQNVGDLNFYSPLGKVKSPKA